jgi:hypothetical protein
MPRVLRRARWLVVLTWLLMALASLPARAAQPYGLLDHYEICSPPSAANDYHNYVGIHSIAVDPAGYIYVAADDGSIRVLSAGGQPLGTLDTGPTRDWVEPVVANGPAGIVYIGDQGGPTDPAQLAKYTLSGGNLVLAHNYDTTNGGYRTTTGIIEVDGLAATQNRGLFILDATQGIVNLNEQDGSFKSLTLPGGQGRLVAMTAIPNAIVTAATNDDGTPDRTAYYAGDPLQYVAQVNVGPFVVGVADGYDGSVWVLDQNGLEHYKIGQLLGTLPVYGYALDTTSDGSIWVASQDGILHIGPGGSVIPPDQYGHAPCGGPQISDSLPHQSVRASHQLQVGAQCADPCSLISAATMTVQGSGTTYHVVTPPASYSANGTFALRLRLKSPGYNALVNAVNHHRTGTVLLSMGAIDAGDVRAYFQQRITIARLSR